MPKNFTKEEEQNKLNKKLIAAVKNNDFSSVKTSVEAGALVNCKDKYKNSPLYYALYSSLDILEFLLENGADPNEQIKENGNSLHIALGVKSELSTKRIKILLKYGADMYAENKQGQTPFVFNVIVKNNDVMKDFFLSQGYIPSEKDYAQIKNFDLFTAVQEDDLPAVKAAVEAGADINIQDKYGIPALLRSMFQKTEITEYLIEAGANLNIKDKDNDTFLHKAVIWALLDKIKFFLKYNPDMYIKDYSGNTPFTTALIYHKYDIAELFVLNGYIPTDKSFEKIKNITEGERESVKTRFMTLASQVQEHKKRLTEETKAMEFAYADEVIEM